MGSRPNFEVFVGVKLVSEYDDDGLKWSDVSAKLPVEIIDEDGDLHWNDDKIKEAIGFVVNRIQSCDEQLGFGVPVFHTDWDDAYGPFDVAELTTKIENAKAVFTEWMAKVGVQWEIGVFQVADYR
jgi:hypothetical protein